MFITVKRHEREKQELLGASTRLTDAILKSIAQGIFLFGPKDKILPQTSTSLAGMFRRQDLTNLSFDKLIAPVVTAKTLSIARAYVAKLLDSTRSQPDQGNPLLDVEVKLPNEDGTTEAAHYSFEFNPVDLPHEPRLWLVRVTDITARVQQFRELEDLRTHIQTHGEVLRSVLQGGGGRFGAFLQKTDASMKKINEVLKKPAREADAFRGKLEETLEEVDRVRRDAAALAFTGLEASARSFEDALQDLRTRDTLSGGDFLPLAVKLDEMYGQFSLIRSVASHAGPVREPQSTASETRMTQNGTQIIEAPKFLADMAQKSALPGAHRMAPAGSLESTLSALTELVAQEYDKRVVFDCRGLNIVPARYQATIKNVAIQLIRNAVMHGIESPSVRETLGKPATGMLQLEFKNLADQGFELLFQDDGCGLDPDKVRATAVASGLVTEDAAARLRDRQAIKLIFKSAYSTLPAEPGKPPHGTGMSLVRRYVHEAGGKIALASLIGHETRFKVSLPAVAQVDFQVA